MAHLNLTLQFNRTGFTRESGQFKRFFVFGATLDNDELCVRTSQGSDYLANISITMLESDANEDVGTLGYSEPWVDHGEGTRYPGHLQFRFSLRKDFLDFLVQSETNQELQASIEIIDPLSAIEYIGPDEEGEYQWHFERARGLQAILTSCGRSCQHNPRPPA